MKFNIVVMLVGSFLFAPSKFSSTPDSG